MIELLLVAERLLAEGDIDRAERLFEQVAEADPRNAIAVVGLAQVAQARGDAAGAIRLATRALEIDPDEAAAQQLVADLDEVPAAAVEPDRAIEPALPTARRNLRSRSSQDPRRWSRSGRP